MRSAIVRDRARTKLTYCNTLHLTACSQYGLLARNRQKLNCEGGRATHSEATCSEAEPAKKWWKRNRGISWLASGGDPHASQIFLRPFQKSHYSTSILFGSKVGDSFYVALQRFLS